MDYFTYVLTTFLGLERVSCVAVYAVQGEKAVGFHPKFLNLRSEDKQGHFWANYPFNSSAK